MKKSIRTSAAESLFAEADEQVETEITVGAFVEVFQLPRMSPVVLHVLQTATHRSCRT